MILSRKDAFVPGIEKSAAKDFCFSTANISWATLFRFNEASANLAIP